MTVSFFPAGAIFLLLLFIPNALWTKCQPQGYAAQAARENRLLLAMERIGQVLVSCAALVQPVLPHSRLHYCFLAGAAMCMLLYELFWLRYFRSAHTMQDFYSSLLGIPVAGATLPVAAFLLLGLYARSVWLLASVAILGVGHIGIHLAHRRQLAESETNRPDA